MLPVKKNKSNKRTDEENLSLVERAGTGSSAQKSYGTHLPTQEELATEFDVIAKLRESAHLNDRVFASQQVPISNVSEPTEVKLNIAELATEQLQASGFSKEDLERLQALRNKYPCFSKLTVLDEGTRYVWDNVTLLGRFTPDNYIGNIHIPGGTVKAAGRVKFYNFDQQHLNFQEFLTKAHKSSGLLGIKGQIKKSERALRRTLATPNGQRLTFCTTLLFAGANILCTAILYSYLSNNMYSLSNSLNDKDFRLIFSSLGENRTQHFLEKLHDTRDFANSTKLIILLSTILYTIIVSFGSLIINSLVVSNNELQAKHEFPGSVTTLYLGKMNTIAGPSIGNLPNDPLTRYVKFEGKYYILENEDVKELFRYLPEPPDAEETQLVSKPVVTNETIVELQPQSPIVAEKSSQLPSPIITAEPVQATVTSQPRFGIPIFGGYRGGDRSQLEGMRLTQEDLERMDTINNATWAARQQLTNNVKKLTSTTEESARQAIRGTTSTLLNYITGLEQRVQDIETQQTGDTLRNRYRQFGIPSPISGTTSSSTDNFSSSAKQEGDENQLKKKL